MMMNRVKLEQLKTMRESEDHVEFKKGEGGNVSYNGAGKDKPKDRRRCILGYVVALCNEGGGYLVIGMYEEMRKKINTSIHSDIVPVKDVDVMSIKQEIADKLSINREIVDKLSINADFINKMSDIIVFLQDNPHSKTGDIADILKLSVSSTKRFLRALVELQMITPEGANKNRTYSIAELKKRGEL